MAVNRHVDPCHNSGMSRTIKTSQASSDQPRSAETSFPVDLSTKTQSDVSQGKIILLFSKVHSLLAYREIKCNISEK